MKAGVCHVELSWWVGVELCVRGTSEKMSTTSPNSSSSPGSELCKFPICNAKSSLDEFWQAKNSPSGLCSITAIHFIGFNVGDYPSVGYPNFLPRFEGSGESGLQVSKGPFWQMAHTDTREILI